MRSIASSSIVRSVGPPLSDRGRGPLPHRRPFQGKGHKQTPVPEFIRDRLRKLARRRGYSTLSGILATLIKGRAS